MVLTWNNALIIDNGIIDEDHKFLISKISDLLETIQSSEDKELILQKLDVIRMFAEKHFDREEELQKTAGFPQCADHKAIHNDMLDELISSTKTLLSKCNAQNNAESRAGCKLAVEAFMRQWLIKHIAVEDTKMIPYVHAMYEKSAGMLPLMGYLRKLVESRAA